MPTLACPARCTTPPSPSHRSHPARAPHCVCARVLGEDASGASHTTTNGRATLRCGTDETSREPAENAYRIRRRGRRRTSTRANPCRTTRNGETRTDRERGGGGMADHPRSPPHLPSHPIPVLSDPLARPRRIAQKICTFASASVSASRSAYEYLRAGLRRARLACAFACLSARLARSPSPSRRLPFRAGRTTSLCVVRPSTRRREFPPDVGRRTWCMTRRRRASSLGHASLKVSASLDPLGLPECAHDARRLPIVRAHVHTVRVRVYFINKAGHSVVPSCASKSQRCVVTARWALTTHLKKLGVRCGNAKPPAPFQCTVRAARVLRLVQARARNHYATHAVRHYPTCHCNVQA
ncbi:hypothetical protein OH77DRAFT_292694 [Trametes cingulata]|nr:hypothetical protein OH77DRAFT_292694 [Trametes cingulata]